MKFENTFERAFSIKRITKQIKRDFRKRLFINSIGRKILGELKYLDQYILDVLVLGQPQTVEEFERLINAHIELELRMKDQRQHTKYHLGDGENYFNVTE